MKYLKTLPIVLFFILSFFLYWKITHIKESKELSSALLNKDLPILPLEFFEGNISLNDIYKKEPFIINYFASWCAPCRVEHKVLDKFSRDNIIIGIAYKDSKKNVKSFLEELGNPYKAVLLDEKGRAAIELGLYGVPETYFVDASGKIKYKQVGPLTIEKFENIINLLNK
ncbi:MAG: DsbE family thiol:disulfide interchange protein [Rickettsiales bacterium]|nr:DsbE family thiol:disulfide interchange protein [Rickettsiales bacterium]OUV81297.1 MAG: hypothetical protein CBC91_02445 [Rickettsiales bacterium TMED131]